MNASRFAQTVLRPSPLAQSHLRTTTELVTILKQQPDVEKEAQGPESKCNIRKDGTLPPAEFALAEIEFAENPSKCPKYVCARVHIIASRVNSRRPDCCDRDEAHGSYEREHETGAPRGYGAFLGPREDADVGYKARHHSDNRKDAEESERL